MKARHTPGPWFSGELRTHGADPSKDGCDIGSENGSNIAIVLHQEDDRKQQETVANAYLVSAAPELLAALTRLLKMCESQHDFNDNGDGRMLDVARAAITKATGATA